MSVTQGLSGLNVTIRLRGRKSDAPRPRLACVPAPGDNRMEASVRGDAAGGGRDDEERADRDRHAERLLPALVAAVRRRRTGLRAARARRDRWLPVAGAAGD